MPTKYYRGYTIRYTDAGLRVTPPGALQWPDPAVNYETATRWIDQHCTERANRKRYFEELSRNEQRNQSQQRPRR